MYVPGACGVQKREWISRNWSYRSFGIGTGKRAHVLWKNSRGGGGGGGGLVLFSAEIFLWLISTPAFKGRVLW